MRGPYVLRIEGEDFTPSSFGDLLDHNGRWIYNPDQLYRSAQLAAMRVAAEFEVSVEVVGRIGPGGKKEVSAARFSPYRDGNYVLVPLPNSFNSVRYLRPVATPS